MTTLYKKTGAARTHTTAHVLFALLLFLVGSRCAFAVTETIDYTYDKTYQVQFAEYSSISAETSYEYASVGNRVMLATYLAGGSGNTAPTVPALIYPADGAHVSDETPFSWQTSTDIDEGDAVVYQVYVGTDANNIQRVWTGAESSCAPFPLVKGALYYWQVVAKDSHGATAMSGVRSFTWKEGDRPIAEIASPAGGSVLRGITSLAVAGTASDGSGSGVATVEVSIDGGYTWSEATDDSGIGSWSSWSYDLAVTNGVYNILVRATDLSGNEGEYDVVSVTINNLPPSTVIVAPAANAILTGASLLIEGTFGDTAGAPVDRVEVSPDGVNWSATGTITAPNDTDAGPWIFTTRDSYGAVGYHTDIAIDKNGKTHISYRDYTNGDLKYATNDLGLWANTIIDQAGDVGYYTSIAVDSKCDAHISYRTYTDSNSNPTYNLNYATNPSGALEIPVVIDSANSVGDYTSIAVDSGDKVHISYYDMTNTSLKYVSIVSNTPWSPVPVDNSAAVGQYSSIAVDSAGKAHISYYDSTNHDLKYATNASGSWVCTTRDSDGDVGQYSSIAVDPSGKVHISYYDLTNGKIKYATNTDGAWSASFVESSVGVGQYSSIAVDPSGKVHISYYDLTNGNLKYAMKQNGSWTPYTIDELDDMGKYASLALDTSGLAHISYLDNATQDLKLAVQGWSYEWTPPEDGTYTIYSRSVSVTDDVQQNPPSRITVTVDNTAPVVDAGTDKVANAQFTQTATATDLTAMTYSWTEVSGPGTVTFGNPAALSTTVSAATDGAYVLRFTATDAAGHTAYDEMSLTWDTANPSSAITYPADDDVVSGTVIITGTASDSGSGLDKVEVSVDGGTWEQASLTALLDSAGTVGGYISTAVDSAGYSHVSYRDFTNGDLKYATNSTGEWVGSTVDSAGDVGYFTSIAVDGTGHVYIGYYDSTNQNLKYATNATGSWVYTTLDNAGDVGKYSSIAVDSAGHVHIGYYDTTNQDLKYATNATGSWVYATLDSAGDAGKYTSIAVDAAGHVHISYRDVTNTDLKYATNATGSWVYATLDSAGNMGIYTSIAVDSAGHVHIGYYDSTNQDLKYATNATGSWVYTTLDSAGDVGYYASIGVDGSGHVHIGYYDSTNHDLKYATNATGSWVYTTLDSAGDVGSYASISVDADEHAHISYYDSTNGDLKYLASTASWSTWFYTLDTTQLSDGSHTILSRATDVAGNVETPGAGVTVTVDKTPPVVDAGADKMAHAQFTQTATATDLTAMTYSWTKQSGPGAVTFGSSDALSPTVSADTDGVYLLRITATDAAANASYDEMSLMWDTAGPSSAITYPEDEAVVSDTVTVTGTASDSGSGLDKVEVSVDGGTWYEASSAVDPSISTLDSSYNVGCYTSMALDSNGYQHISYRDSTHGDLKYVTNASGTWGNPVTLDSTGDVGYYTSIAVDASGYAHIAYLDMTNKDLKYVTNTNANEFGSWEAPVTVDSTGDIGYFPSIAVYGGNVYIAYYDSTNQDLKCVTKSSGSWGSPVTLDSAGDVGKYASLAMDSDGHLHISYRDVTNGDLKYVTNASGSWESPVTLDSAGNVGIYTSLALDAGGNVHIGYYDSTNQDLKCVTKSSGSWGSPVTLDSTGNVGEWLSLAVDGGGRVHISYYDGTGGNLKYATNSLGGWTKTTLDSSGDVGYYTSIAAGPDGRVYISYYDITNGDLKALGFAPPWSYALDTTQLSDGSHTILSRATDVAGNVETPGAGVTVTVDNSSQSSQSQSSQSQSSQSTFIGDMMLPQFGMISEDTANPLPTVTLDKQWYSGPEDRAVVTVVDENSDLDFGPGNDTVTVTVTSETDVSGDTVTLQEDGTTPGVFTGSFGFEPFRIFTGNDRVGASKYDMVTVTYAGNAETVGDPVNVTASAYWDCGNSMWVRGTAADNVIDDYCSARENLFGFCSAPHGDGSNRVDTIYLDALSAVNDVNRQNQLKEFLAEAHGRGIRVELLAGGPEWASSTGADSAESAVKSVTNFNDASSEGGWFDGIHIEVAPYRLAAWETNTSTVWSDFISMLSRCRTEVDAYNGEGHELTLAADIPAWYDAAYVGVASPDAVQEIMDYTVIMSGTDNVADTLSLTNHEIEYAVAAGKKAVIGVETGCEPDPDETFCEEGYRVLHSRLGIVVDNSYDANSFLGLGVDDYTEYDALYEKPELPVSTIISPISAVLVGDENIYVRGNAFAEHGVQSVEVSTDGGCNWSMASDTSGNGSWATWSYNWGLPTIGTYTLMSKAMDFNANEEVPNNAVPVIVNSIVVDSLSTDLRSPQDYSTPITWTAIASGGSGVYQYEFLRKGQNTNGGYVVERSADNSNTWEWVPQASEVGINYIKVRLTDVYGGVLTETAMPFMVR